MGTKPSSSAGLPGRRHLATVTVLPGTSLTVSGLSEAPSSAFRFGNLLIHDAPPNLLPGCGSHDQTNRLVSTCTAAGVVPEQMLTVLAVTDGRSVRVHGGLLGGARWERMVGGHQPRPSAGGMVPLLSPRSRARAPPLRGAVPAFHAGEPAASLLMGCEVVRQ